MNNYIKLATLSIGLAVIIIGGVMTVRTLHAEYLSFREQKCHEILASEGFNPWVSMQNKTYRSSFYSVVQKSCLAIDISWGTWESATAATSTATSTPATPSDDVAYSVRVFDVNLGLNLREDTFDQKGTVTEESLKKLRAEIVSPY